MERGSSRLETVRRNPYSAQQEGENGMHGEKRKVKSRALGAGVALPLLVVVLGGCLDFGGNAPPIAVFEALPFEGYVPLTVMFDASESFDPDGDALAFSWKFGDGERGEGAQISHTFTEARTYSVALEVIDLDGALSLATRRIVVRDTPEGYDVYHFEWEFDGETIVWDAFLPRNLVETYRGLPRSTFVENYDYASYVEEPLDDPTLESLSAVLWNLVQGDELAYRECTLAFVQGVIRYEEDPPNQERPKYPLETLADQTGDCEDTSILYTSLVKAAGIDSYLAFVDTDDDRTPDHVASLVAVPATYAGRVNCPPGTERGLFVVDSQLTAFGETTAGPDTGGYLPLGCDPWMLDEQDLVSWWGP
ncbi:PKD domain-containing protein [Candidatus Bipolaricaulota bacterium]|nr:PKD domain-containing protein [Candidatus Bipolaricaulota bacterium]